MFGERYFGNRYFGPRYWGNVGAVSTAPTDDVSASFSQEQLDSFMQRQHYVPSSSHYGSLHHHFLSLFRGLRPAGA